MSRQLCLPHGGGSSQFINPTNIVGNPFNVPQGWAEPNNSWTATMDCYLVDLFLNRNVTIVIYINNIYICSLTNPTTENTPYICLPFPIKKGQTVKITGGSMYLSSAKAIGLLSKT